MEEHKSRYELFLKEQEKPQEKRCSKCGKAKAANEFWERSPQEPGKLRSRCKLCMKPPKYKDENDRFWKGFHRRTQKIGRCLEWTGAVTSAGHPFCNYQGKYSMVRRVVYQLSCGELLDNLFVATTCHNLRCVRQSHLTILTKEEMDARRFNSLKFGDESFPRLHPERLARGDRHGSRVHPERLRRGDNHPARIDPSYLPRGEAHSRARLTEDDVREIRRMSASGLSQRELARRFEVSRCAVVGVIKGKTWKHVQ